MRDARPADREAVFAFTRRTWGDYGDFVPRVWHSWIADRRGRLVVAELAGVPVGIAKITDFGRGEIWLEGLRVDPKHRHKGIARAINIEVARTLARMKPRAVRYCTGGGNRASRHIGRRFGFKTVVRMRYYWLKPRAGKLVGAYATVRDAREVYDFIKASRFIRATSGLVAEGWIFRELTPRLVGSYLKRRSVMVIRRSGALAGVAVYPVEKNDGVLSLGFIDGDAAAVRDLAGNCRKLAAARGDKSCSAAVPCRVFPALLDAAGFPRKESMRQVVLQYAGRW
jgi:GNAT superfamily N-acetyltransferase